ncbi:periplasmic protein [Aeromonas phage CC2]|uniref:Uncharacterized protein n=1 Tax=Aeromonas phage CC2 TaxID=1204516 RepID=I6WBY6_9CAUD|nr:periplasmic protein [Aeromonas phage CC2]AFN39460.1 hypothetical protein CC2_415 [Aeromonas phage CC2]
MRNFNSNQPWFFRHFNKIFTVFIIGILLMVVAQFALVGYAAVNVQEQGLKGVAESIWCGSNQNTDECKESIRGAFIDMLKEGK